MPSAGKPLVLYFKVLIAAACFMAGGFILPVPVAHAETLKTSAPMAYLFEPESKTILFAKEADKPFEPGSLAKVMTAATVFAALSEGEIFPHTKCRISEHAWRTGGAPAGGTTMFAAIKSEIEVLDLLQGLIVQNGNDSAIALAECLDGSEAKFAERMTALARQIGMTGSRFANPTGYESEVSQTTVRDMVRLADYILEHHRAYYPMFSQPDFTWNKIFQRNKDPLLGEIRGQDGLGAGQSEKDGYAALASVERDGRRVIAAVAGLPSDKARLAAAKEVIEGSWEYFGISKLYSRGETITNARVFGGTRSDVPLVASEDVSVLLPRGTTLDYRLRVVYSGPLKAPVSAGTAAGELRVIGENGIVYRAPLETGAAVPEGNMQEKALDGLMELLFGWL
ncbi:D-alanyl-D-alanine carboxypeptidase family protein [Roseibium aggregatum]|nr:D-alanyl-D-alanine carboxypeptidase family protein [Roseibium aggregatum]